DATSDRPAKAVSTSGSGGDDWSAVGRDRCQAQVGFHAAVGPAAGRVEQHGQRKRDAHAATDGSEPLKLVREGCRRAYSSRDAGQEAPRNTTEGGCRPLLATPLCVGLNAEHPVRRLPVVTDLAAEHAAVQIPAAACSGRKGRSGARIEEV